MMITLFWLVMILLTKVPEIISQMASRMRQQQKSKDTQTSNPETQNFMAQLMWWYAGSTMYMVQCRVAGRGFYFCRNFLDARCLPSFSGEYQKLCLCYIVISRCTMGHGIFLKKGRAIELYIKSGRKNTKYECRFLQFCLEVVQCI